jgi:SAM-dependent methyltransferase
MNCRHCAAPLELSFVDLGSAPPSNAYLSPDALTRPEKWFPLRVLVCESCWLVQTEDFAAANELFDEEYAYFSSFSRSWLEHAERYVASMIDRFQLAASDTVVEVAANDGYLLQFVQRRGIPCLGVEPTESTAAAATAKGIPIVQDFFGVKLAESLSASGHRASLMTANNVLAHVPDINDFVSGFRMLLRPGGVATFEFPHLLRLVSGNQFDTIYHEHFSYLSLTAVSRILARNGLVAFDVEEHPTHGGSLRVFAQRTDGGGHAVTPRVGDMLEIERRAGMTSADFYAGFQEKTDRVKNDFLRQLLTLREKGATVAAYGAAAKGNTLMNYAGVRPDLIRFVVDQNPAKQGKHMPGSRIPIVDADRLSAEKPDYIVILPWNLREEIQAQLSYCRRWGARFITAVPSLEIS